MPVVTAGYHVTSVLLAFVQNRLVVLQ